MHKMPRKRSRVETTGAPAALGPYSQAIRMDRTVYISGQIGVSPRTMSLVRGGVEEQAEQAFKNLDSVIKAAKGTLRDVVKTTLLLQDIRDFDRVNQIYEQFFPDTYPARAAYQVQQLAKGALIEVEAVAVIGAQTAGAVFQLK